MMRADSLEPNSEKFHSSISFHSDTLYSRLKNKCRKVMKNITLEPIMLVMSLVSSMDGVAVSQLLIDKSCARDFNFTEEVCDHLLADGNEDANENVQNEVAQYKVYESIVDHLFPVICSFFLGSWSDNFGRKIILYIYFVFRLIEGSLLWLNAYFISWPKEFMLFSVNLPVAISGGHLAYSMGINAFIADVSTPDQRSFRMAMMHFISSLGRPFGTQAGAYLYDKGGYICVIGATVIGRLVTFILIIWRLETFHWKATASDKAEETRVKKRHALSPSHVLDSLKTALKPRPNGKRFYLWVYLFVLITMVLPFFGEMTIGYNYVRTRYDWTVDDYSNYRTVTEIVDITGQSVFIPLLGYLSIRDSILIPFLLLQVLTRDVVKAYAVKPWLFYLGSVINPMGGYAFAASRSIISKCVDASELGKVFALLAALESLVPIGMSQVYASIWKVTSGLGTAWVGTVYLISGGIMSISLIISIFSLISLRGRSISELDEPAATKPVYRYRGPGARMSMRAKTGAWAYPPPSYFTDGFDTFDNGVSGDSASTPPPAYENKGFDLEDKEDKQRGDGSIDTVSKSVGDHVEPSSVK